MQSNKEELREIYRAKRAHQPAVNKCAQAALENLSGFSPWNEASRPLVYVSTKYEMDTKELIRLYLEEHDSILVPYCESRSKMYATPIYSMSGLAPGRFGILEPVNPMEGASNTTPDFVLVPGVVFDRYGNRIGQGSGYYDRYLRSLPEDVVKVGFAFENQMYPDMLVTEEHDVAVDYIITEEGLITCD